MLKEKKLNIMGQLLLLMATLAWGTSFFILKETIADAPAIFIVGARFFLSSVIFALIFIKKTIKINLRTMLHGAILGGIIFVAYLTQTAGLKYTTPSRNAFITSLYCVMTPFIVWAVYKKKPKSYNIISALLCVVGIGLVALSRDSGNASDVLRGDMLTLCCSLFYALQILFIDKYRGKDDTMQLLTVELFVTGVLLLLYSAIFELKEYGIEKYALKGDMLKNFIYLTLVCTLFAQFAQIFGQKYASANQTAIILSLEAVFGMLFSVILGNEKITLILGAGFAVIFVGIIISELKLDPFGFLRKGKKDNKKSEEAEKEKKLD